VWKLWYPVLTRLTQEAGVTFLNYGYADGGAGPALEARDEPDRVCIQLYDRVAGAVDLRGLRVLEVSCGHGGGASYVARCLKPATMIGVDRNGRAVERCQAVHQVEGLTFSQGDAMALDFANGSFDAVVNVEASHCYPDVPRFLGEVARVLRPGGHLLYADFRDVGEARDRLHAQLVASGLEVVACEDISASVARGMELNTDRSLELIRTLVPRLLRRPARSFAGVTESPIYKALRSGATIYFRYVLLKPATSTR
jgi:SAM-dependent methyltransferase